MKRILLVICCWICFFCSAQRVTQKELKRALWFTAQGAEIVTKADTLKLNTIVSYTPRQRKELIYHVIAYIDWGKKYCVFTFGKKGILGVNDVSFDFCGLGDMSEWKYVFDEFEQCLTLYKSQHYFAKYWFKEAFTTPKKWDDKAVNSTTTFTGLIKTLVFVKD